MMHAHLVQLDIQWENPTANHAAVRHLLGKTNPPISTGDLILLPEMFDTGFSLNIETTADTNNTTLDFLVELARQYRCFVQGGRTVLPHDDADHAQDTTHKAHNRMSVIDPDGNLICEYTKIHPFSFGREPERFAGGCDIALWNWHADGQTQLRVCPAICYDLRFPELFRRGVLAGAEMFALGACWPAARKDHWRALTIARAIENQAFVLAANRTGDDPHLSYAGGSIAIDPQGRILGELGDEQSVLSVPVDRTILDAWRSRFPALNDIRITRLDGFDKGQPLLDDCLVNPPNRDQDATL